MSHTVLSRFALASLLALALFFLAALLLFCFLFLTLLVPLCLAAFRLCAPPLASLERPCISTAWAALCCRLEPKHRLFLPKYLVVLDELCAEYAPRRFDFHPSLVTYSSIIYEVRDARLWLLDVGVGDALIVKRLIDGNPIADLHTSRLVAGGVTKIGSSRVDQHVAN